MGDPIQRTQVPVPGCTSRDVQQTQNFLAYRSLGYLWKNWQAFLDRLIEALVFKGVSPAFSLPPWVTVRLSGIVCKRRRNK